MEDGGEDGDEMVTFIIPKSDWEKKVRAAKPHSREKGKLIGGAGWREGLLDQAVASVPHCLLSRKSLNLYIRIGFQLESVYAMPSAVMEETGTTGRVESEKGTLPSTSSTSVICASAVDLMEMEDGNSPPPTALPHTAVSNGTNGHHSHLPSQDVSPDKAEGEQTGPESTPTAEPPPLLHHSQSPGVRTATEQTSPDKPPALSAPVLTLSTSKEDDEDVMVLEPESTGPGTETGKESMEELRKKADEIRERLVSRLSQLRAIGPHVETDFAVLPILQGILLESQANQPELIKRLLNESNLTLPIALFHPPSQVVELCAEYPSKESVAQLRSRLLPDFTPPEESDFETRAKEDFSVKYEAHRMTKVLHDIGRSIVQKRVYTDFVHKRNLPSEVPERSEQADRIAESVKPHLADVSEKIAHLKTRTFRCPKKRCDFLAHSALVLAHHRQFAHTENDSFICGLCDYHSLEKEELEQHYQSRHKLTMLYEPPLEKAPCPLCPLGFDLKGMMIAHLKDCKQTQNRWNLRQMFKPTESDVSAVNQLLWSKTRSLALTAPAPSRPTPPPSGPPVQQRQSVGIRPGLPAASRPNILVPRASSNLFAASRQYRPLAPATRPMYSFQTPNLPRRGRPCGPAALVSQVVRPMGPVAGVRGAEGCEICDLVLPDRYSLFLHFRSFHKKMLTKEAAEMANGAPLSCSQCQERFWTYEGLERHLLMSHDLVTSDLLRKAQRKADTGRCRFCSKQYAFNLLQHLVQDHKKKLCSAEIDYSCDVCSYSCNSYTNLEAHLASKHSSGQKRTAVNPSLFQPSAKAPKLNPAPATSAAKLRYTCTPCSLKFNQYSEVIRHWADNHLKKIRIHSCRVDECQECSIQFAAQGLNTDLTLPPETTPPPASGTGLAASLTGSQGHISRPSPPAQQPITLD